MKITMISNYINHHQIPFSNAIFEQIGEAYHFIQTEKMEEKRIAMGWGVDPKIYPYVLEYYENKEACRKAIDECDVLIVGWLEDESIIKDRLRSGKLVLRISERLYREGQWKFLSPKGLIRKYKDHISLNKYPVYLLCNGAYVASDYNLICAYPGRKYKFGYFPETRRFKSWEELSNKKTKLNIIEIEGKEELPEEPPVLTDNEIQIVWAGRFIELKHPEYIIRLASTLVKKGYRFHINMVGSGSMEEDLKESAEYELVSDYITFYGFKSPEEVREIMEMSHIHIFTSSFLEGWGAVVNEGMNAGLATVVNAEVGAAPFLIENGKNGISYNQGKYEELEKELVNLLGNPQKIEKMGRMAYETIVNYWNAEVAAKRVIEFCNGWQQGCLPKYENGPMSVADNIKPRFFISGKLAD